MVIHDRGRFLAKAGGETQKESEESIAAILAE